MSPRADGLHSGNNYKPHALRLTRGQGERPAPTGLLREGLVAKLLLDELIQGIDGRALLLPAKLKLTDEFRAQHQGRLISAGPADGLLTLSHSDEKERTT